MQRRVISTHPLFPRGEGGHRKTAVTSAIPAEFRFDHRGRGGEGGKKEGSIDQREDACLVRKTNTGISFQGIGYRRPYCLSTKLEKKRKKVGSKCKSIVRVFDF